MARRHIEMIEEYLVPDDKCHDYQYHDNHGILVRCRDCKHWKCYGDAEDGDYDIGTCELYNQGFGAECFCSYGERRYT